MTKLKWKILSFCRYQVVSSPVASQGVKENRLTSCLKSLLLSWENTINGFSGMLFRVCGCLCINCVKFD